MPTRERLMTIGTARGRRLLGELAGELRHARLAAGLTQEAVGSAVRLSKATISRIERGRVPIDILTAAQVARVLGLDLSVRCFPAAGQLRDAAHVALVRRLLAVAAPSLVVKLEVPIRPADLRAWDVVLSHGRQRVAVAAETRLRDLQALLRREQQKCIHSGIDTLLLVVADTKHNRDALRESRAVLERELPWSSRRILSAIRAGRLPERAGVAVL
jgi:transcriptional regulator with XRE-family HTH domain